MGKFIGYIPLIATAIVEIQADNENEAWEKLDKMYNKGEIDLNGYDAEAFSSWWIEEDNEE